ncbi:MAG: 2-oxo acid dehydrogenase subunit E2 [Alphaproteobacteria bacterium]|nr:2-oxo acid dehydrogenase subunit E2 [Alphaproteobacteria bacterium]
MAMTVRQKLAIASWKAPQEGNIYGKLTLDATEALKYLAWLRETSGEKVTITHLVGKAVAQALQHAPKLNGVIRFGSFVPRQTIDIAFLVALEEGKNLAKAKVCDYDQKSVVDVAKELRELAERLYSGKDENFNKSMGPLKFLPTWIIRPLVKTMGYLSSVLGLSVPALGVEAYPFGSCIITNVGVFGLDEGYVPPTPFAHVPLYVLIGALKEAPWVNERHELEVRPQLTITATIDHRYMDGAQGGVLAEHVRKVFADPWALSGLEGHPEAAADAV